MWQPPDLKQHVTLTHNRCSSHWAHQRKWVNWTGCDSSILLMGKLPQSIPWTPLCLCPCAKRSRLPQLARSLAKYWRLLVETQPVKTVWKGKDLDATRAKNTTGRWGGIQTHPDLPTGLVEERMDRTSKGREENMPPNPTERERQNNKGLGATQREWQKMGERNYEISLISMNVLHSWMRCGRYRLS